ncbi:MAG: 5'-methylthioadenosine/adenosylhomocysteine nucleosidase [Christensenellaceae bacterium]|nr:5'-methylthioadenosine/adenosylhomocysteine nucleosidase [Christensenellaceae bacterium]
MIPSDKIGFLIALRKEASTLIEMMTDRRESKIGRLVFYQGKIVGVDAVIVITGVGKVLAASAASRLIDHFEPSLLISTGVAGGLYDCKVLDVVIASSVSQHDFDCTPLGERYGLMPDINLISIPTCEEALKILKTVLPNAIIGNVSSGDQFVSSNAKREFISKTFSAIACDMECGAIGQIAALEKIPFIAIKIISDNADESASISFDAFIDKAAEINVAAITNSIRQLSTINYKNIRK